MDVVETLTHPMTPISPSSVSDGACVESQTRKSGHLKLRAIRKRYAAADVLTGIDLEIAGGEFLTILGPSGSGKTTLLKIVAGFEHANAGEILLDGKNIAAVDPAARNIGMVFQHYALFPHMTVRDNVAFPLRMRNLPRDEISSRVVEALGLVRLADFADRYPKQLSGGQQQRVALARAIVYRPALLLLDEPFGALDRKLREQMQLEVRSLQQQLGLTTLFITHDQEEALVMSDRIAVMNHGRLEQIGRPSEVYERPATRFVADFIGESNILSGTLVLGVRGAELHVHPDLKIPLAEPVDEAHLGEPARVLIRPERLSDQTDGTCRADDISLTGQVTELVYVGTALKCRVRTVGGIELLARFGASARHNQLRVGSVMTLGFKPAEACLLKSDTGQDAPTEGVS